MKLVLAFCAGVLVAIGMSGRAETWGVVTVGSEHLNGKQYCEFNPGAGIETGGDTRYLLGFYENSLCDTVSLYFGVAHKVLKKDGWSAGFSGLVITGYESEITLGAALVLSYEGKRNGVNLVWFPSKKGDITEGVIALQIKRRF